MDRRIFIPVDHDSYAWRDLDKERTAVERVNSRLGVSFRVELHTVPGLKKMRLRVGLALGVMLAMAPLRLGHG